MKGVKDLHVSLMLEFYGKLLKERQAELLDMYYNLDYSLSEIAENKGITRQAAFEQIKKSEAYLEKCEEAVGMYKKFEVTTSALLELEELLKGYDGPNADVIKDKIEQAKAVWED